VRNAALMLVDGVLSVWGVVGHPSGDLRSRIYSICSVIPSISRRMGSLSLLSGPRSNNRVGSIGLDDLHLV